ncbi:4999_t:CDS:2 [Scutellospora calospora]|uniref:4999_t:CDS:1 n=1 Tax=Scutellospora calospora TaxID=85575 RepID=A0ACA9KD20_9GLOM|nr:4999_t:CDS:2 [Scutellospora calospora]
MLTAVLKPKTRKSISKPSRKGKKAWRKNVDITEVEEALERIREEERTLGGNLNDIPTEKLFAVDVKGVPEVKTKIDKKFAKLHIDQVLENHSKIPEVFSKQRPSYDKKHGSKYNKMTLEKFIKKNQSKNSSDIQSSEVVKRTGEYDVWAQVHNQSEDFLHLIKEQKIKPPPTLNMKPAVNIPAVHIPHHGSSYMPSFKEHQELLMIAHEEEVVKLRKMEHIKSKLPSIPSAFKIEGIINENDEKSEDDDSGSEEIKEKFIVKTKEQRRKTKAERNKEKRKLASMKEVEQKKTLKVLKKELEKNDKALYNCYLIQHQNNRLPELLKTVEIERAEHEEKMVERTKLAEEMTKMPKKKIGKYRVRKAPIDFKLTEELEGALRLLKPEGNLFRDRMISYEERNIIEPRVPVR